MQPVSMSLSIRFGEENYCNPRIHTAGWQTMPDLGWPGWGIMVSILLAIIPVLYRLWQVLAESKDLIIEIVGLVVLMGAFYLYMATMPQWLQVQALIAQPSTPSNPGLGQQIHTIPTVYFGSIGLMMVGGLLTLFGLLGRLTTITSITKR